MKKLIVFLLCMVLCVGAMAGAADRYVNFRVFGTTDARLQKMLKYSKGNYIHVTVFDSVVTVTPTYMTVYYTSLDTMQYFLIGELLSPVTYSMKTHAQFDSVHIVRLDTTTAVNGFISRVK